MNHRPDHHAPTGTEQFKLECLARHAIRQRDPTAFLGRWRAKHGDGSATQLHEAMRRARMERRAA